MRPGQIVRHALMLCEQEEGAPPKEIGPESFQHMLLDAGADPRFAGLPWVANHLRWVLWKLASYEHRYPGHLAGKMLAPAVVLDELKKRYQSSADSFIQSGYPHLGSSCIW